MAVYLQMGLVAMSICALLVGIYWAKQKAQRLRSEQEAELRRFEIETMGSFSKSAGARSAAAPSAAKAAGSEVVQPRASQSSFPEFPSSATPQAAVAIVAETSTSTPSSTSATTSGTGEATNPTNAFSQSLLDKLGAANLVNTVDGPVRAKNAAITGVIVLLKNGKRIALLDHAFKSDDTEYEGLLRFYDGIIAPGPGDQSVFVERYDSYVGGLIKI